MKLVVIAGAAPLRWRPAESVLALYLLLTLPLLLASPVRTAGAVAMHLAGFAIAAAATAGRLRGPAGRVVGDWLPLLAVPLLYAELPVLMAAGGAVYHDGLVQALERALFPSNPSLTLAAAVPVPALSELLHAAYFLYYPLIYVPPAVLYLTGRRAEFRMMVLATAATFAMCFLAFSLFPVQGPRYLWTPPQIPTGPMRSLVLRVLESGSSRGAAFPSSHVAVAVVVTAMAFGFRMRGAVLCAVITAGLAAGAVYGGFHYAVDVVAGAVLGCVAGLLVLRATDATPEGPSRVDST